MEQQTLPEDLHPRVLIQAIQTNLGITKKEISERTGISYGTLNRYTRNKTSICRPRRRSIERLRQLYQVSLRKFVVSGDGERPGTDYNNKLLLRTGSGQALETIRSGACVPFDAGGLHGLHPLPLSRFLGRVVRYAVDDVEEFKASGCRNRDLLLRTRELVGRPVRGAGQ